MNATFIHAQPGRCFNHPDRETVLRCGKCERFICTRCSIQTPVGARCQRCAQSRRLPQYDVQPLRLLAAAGAGFVTSLVSWFLISFIPYLRFFLAILVGIAVAEVMTRVSRRRVNRVLEILAITDVIAGFVLLEMWLSRYDLSALLALVSQNTNAVVSLALPMIVGSFVAVIKLR